MKSTFFLPYSCQVLFSEMTKSDARNLLEMDFLTLRQNAFLDVDDWLRSYTQGYPFFDGPVAHPRVCEDVFNSKWIDITVWGEPTDFIECLRRWQESHGVRFIGFLHLPTFSVKFLRNLAIEVEAGRKGLELDEGRALDWFAQIPELKSLSRNKKDHWLKAIEFAAHCDGDAVFSASVRRSMEGRRNG